MPHSATSGITRDNKIHPLGTMNVYSKYHDHPSNHCHQISLNSTSAGLFVMIEKKSEDRQIWKDTSSGDHECLHYFINIILLHYMYFSLKQSGGLIIPPQFKMHRYCL